MSTAKRDTDLLIKIANTHDNQGGIYRTDPDYDVQLSKFIESHPNYKLTFNVAGRYGPTIYYCSGPNVYPSKIESGNDSLLMETDDNYDIGIL